MMRNKEILNYTLILTLYTTLMLWRRKIKKQVDTKLANRKSRMCHNSAAYETRYYSNV